MTTEQLLSRTISARTRLELAQALGIDVATLEAGFDNDHEALAEWFRLHAKSHPKINPRYAQDPDRAMKRIQEVIEAHGPTAPGDLETIYRITGFMEYIIGAAAGILFDRGELVINEDGRLEIVEN